MKFQILMIASLSCLVACKPAAETETQTQAEQPMPEKRPHELTLHDHTRVDEYYWLRDDTRKDPDMLAYLEEENEYFDKMMEHNAGLQDTLFKEMTVKTLCQAVSKDRVAICCDFRT